METAIPHLVEPHPVTGIPNGKFGIWLFLASEVMLFGALFSSYVLIRTGAPHWPPEGGLSSEILNVPLGTFNTAVLITSSITVVSSTPSASDALAVIPVAMPRNATRCGAGWSSRGTRPWRRSFRAAALPPST